VAVCGDLALAGLGEELLFRGVMQQRCHGSMSRGIVLTSVVFGLALHYAALWLAGGAERLLGWLLVSYENLVVPVVTHGRTARWCM
jgi:membrane protease YdiL (CAAX protease family)